MDLVLPSKQDCAPLRVHAFMIIRYETLTADVAFWDLHILCLA
jgi:hypothetical protein